MLAARQDLTAQLLLVYLTHLHRALGAYVPRPLRPHVLQLLLQLFGLVGVDEIAVHVLDAVQQRRLLVYLD